MNLSQMSVTVKFLHPGQQSQAGKHWCYMKGEKDIHSLHV